MCDGSGGWLVVGGPRTKNYSKELFSRWNGMSWKRRKRAEKESRRER